MATRSKDLPTETTRDAAGHDLADKGEKNVGAGVLPQKSGNSEPPVTAHSFRASLRKAAFTERIQIERDGVPNQVVVNLIERMGISRSEFLRYLRIPKSTFARRKSGKSMFAGTAGLSLVGLLEIVNKVEDLLAAEQENVEVNDFDVERWVGKWIKRPQPALGGIPAGQLIDTPAGRERVMKLIGAIQSGSYQ